MQDNNDRPSVAAVPTLIYVAALSVGIVLDVLWSVSVFPSVVRYGLGIPLVMLGFAVLPFIVPHYHRAGTPYDVRDRAGSVGSWRDTVVKLPVRPDRSRSVESDSSNDLGPEGASSIRHILESYSIEALQNGPCRSFTTQSVVQRTSSTTATFGKIDLTKSKGFQGLRSVIRPNRINGASVM